MRHPIHAKAGGKINEKTRLRRDERCTAVSVILKLKSHTASRRTGFTAHETESELSAREIRYEIIHTNKKKHLSGSRHHNGRDSIPGRTMWR